MREVPVETIPEDILKCDEVHWGGGGETTLFVFQSLLPLLRGWPVCLSIRSPVSENDILIDQSRQRCKSG